MHASQRGWGGGHYLAYTASRSLYFLFSGRIHMALTVDMLVLGRGTEASEEERRF